MRKYFQSSLFLIVSSSIISFVIVALVFPELLIRQKIGFLIDTFDYEYNYASISILLNNYFHGGIQLWNRYDQIPFAYLHLVGGIYSPDHILTALCYMLASKLGTFTDIGYYRFLVVSFFAVTTILRSSIALVFLNRFSKNRIVLFICLILANTLFSMHMYFGFGLVFLYMSFMLAMHFLMSFFENPSVRHFLPLLACFSLIFASHPMFTLSYYYLGVHFFIFSLLFYLLWSRGKMPPNPRRDFSIFQSIAIPVACILVILPSILMLLQNYGDYDFAAESSRFHALFSIAEYFKRPAAYANQSDFFLDWLSFNKPFFSLTWLYLGTSSLFLMIFGSSFSKDPRKIVFIGTIALFWLINSPRNSLGPGMLAHWINALTNPFKFLPRSFHMTGAMLLPYVCLPLVALGLNVLYEPATVTSRSHFRWILAPTLFCTALLSIWNRSGSPVRVYLIASLMIGTPAFWAFSYRRNGKFPFKKLALVAVLSLILMDHILLRQYVLEFLPGKEITPITVTQGLPPSFLEYRRPEASFFREFSQTEPVTDSKETFFYNGQAASRSFQFSSLLFGRYWNPATQYQPRHISYKRIAESKSLKTYILAHPRIFSLIPNELIQDEEGKNFPAGIEPKKVWQTLVWDARSADIRRGDGFKMAVFQLPQDFPDYLGTGIFSKDRNSFEASIGTEILSPSQGEFVQPYSFDVQNIEGGKFIVSLPLDFKMEEHAYQLRYRRTLSDGILKISKNDSDTLEFDVNATRSGWMVLHYPFDKKWDIQIDRTERKLFRVNQCFLGWPLSSGTHHLVLKYWPNTYLRGLIGISSILILGLLFWLIYSEVQRERSSTLPSQ